jgi:hypothetical protein
MTDPKAKFRAGLVRPKEKPRTRLVIDFGLDEDRSLLFTLHNIGHTRSRISGYEDLLTMKNVR